MQFSNLALRTFALGALLCAAACSRPDESGGLTARLVLRTDDGTASQGLSASSGAFGRRGAGLGERAIPDEVRRLEIYAFKADGSTLGKALLDDLPSGNESQLVRAGGTWRIENVPVGTGYTLRARAILGEAAGLDLAGRVGFEGEKTGIAVRSGQLTDAGTIELNLVPGIRLANLDMTPPATPGPVVVTAVPEGEALSVSWNRPSAPDLAGYVVAVTTSSAAPPGLMRRLPPKTAGELLAPDVTVAAWIAQPEMTTVQIPGLTNGRPVRVLVYAYDADLGNAPMRVRALNFSAAALAMSTPVDTVPPGAITGLSVRAPNQTIVVIGLTGTGEDGTTGAAPTYELKVSRRRSQLEDATQFAALPRIANTLNPASGEGTMLQTTFAALGQVASTPFFVGVRGVDAAMNEGPITVAAYTVSGTITPQIQALEPEIALAGQPLEIAGQLFGADTGTVSLLSTTGTTSAMLRLRVVSWADDRIRVDVPANAASGLLTVVRSGAGSSMAAVELAVLARAPSAPGNAALPFVLATARLPGRTLLHALYRALPGASNSFGVERIFGEAAEGTRFGVFSAAAQPFVAAGTYSAVLDRFAFVSASTTGPSRVSLTLLSSSTVAPAAFNRSPLANVANVDGIGVIPLAETASTPPGGVPILLALSSGGRVRTATVPDVLSGGVTRFNVLTPTTAVSDRVQLLETRSGTISTYFLAYRTVTGTTARLSLRAATGQEALPLGFVELAPGAGPELAGEFRLIDVPGGELTIVYEARGAGGRLEVRMLPLSSFGLSPGWAPMADTSASWTLDDVSLARSGAGVTVTLALQRAAAGNTAQLVYVEVPPAELAAAGGSGRGTHRGLALDMAFTPAAGRLGCRPEVGAGCPLLFSGPSATPSLYFRR